MSIRVDSVFIADEIEQECVDTLVNGGIRVEKKTKLPEAELIRALVDGKFKALLVRSATKVTRAVIEAARPAGLEVIGRAGTGVDNIDVVAASEHGVVVMNTPAGNSRSAAELTCALIMSLARQVPQAVSSLKQGKWARKDFMGEEVHGKTLAIIGLGRIGMEVASRMQAFGMTTIGFDPIVSKEAAAKAKIEWLELNQLWPRADYITVHVPLIPQTENLLASKTFSVCKRGVKIINVARGGIVSEPELLDAIKQGQVGGAAIDVFVEEPPKNRELVEHPLVICTPHLGANTREAQQRVAVEIAENIIALDSGKGVFGAINWTEATKRRAL